MKAGIIVLALLLIFASPAHTQTIYKDGEVSYEDGKKEISYMDDAIYISVRSEGRSSLSVYVANNSDQTIDFNPDLITANRIKIKKKKELDVYTAGEYETRRRRNILWFTDNYKTVTTDVKTNASANVSNDVLSPSTNAHGESSTTITERVYTGNKDKAYAELKEYMKYYLKRNTIEPDKETVGFIHFENPGSDPVEIHIPINDAIYVFRFNE